MHSLVEALREPDFPRGHTDDAPTQPASSQALRDKADSGNRGVIHELILVEAALVVEAAVRQQL